MSAVHAFRKHCGKRRNCSLQAISPFPTVFFCTCLKGFLPFSINLKCHRQTFSVRKSLKFVIWERVKTSAFCLGFFLQPDLHLPQRQLLFVITKKINKLHREGFFVKHACGERDLVVTTTVWCMCVSLSV